MLIPSRGTPRPRSGLALLLGGLTGSSSRVRRSPVCQSPGQVNPSLPSRMLFAVLLGSLLLGSAVSPVAALAATDPNMQSIRMHPGVYEQQATAVTGTSSISGKYGPWLVLWALPYAAEDVTSTGATMWGTLGHFTGTSSLATQSATYQFRSDTYFQVGTDLVATSWAGVYGATQSYSFGPSADNLTPPNQWSVRLLNSPTQAGGQAAGGNYYPAWLNDGSTYKWVHLSGANMPTFSTPATTNPSAISTFTVSTTNGFPWTDQPNNIGWSKYGVKAAAVALDTGAQGVVVGGRTPAGRYWWRAVYYYWWAQDATYGQTAMVSWEATNQTSCMPNNVFGYAGSYGPNVGIQCYSTLGYGPTAFKVDAEVWDGLVSGTTTDTLSVRQISRLVSPGTTFTPDPRCLVPNGLMDYTQSTVGSVPPAPGTGSGSPSPTSTAGGGFTWPDWAPAMPQWSDITSSVANIPGQFARGIGGLMWPYSVVASATPAGVVKQ